MIKTQFNTKTFILVICLLCEWSKLTQSKSFNKKDLTQFNYNLSALGEECDPNADDIKSCPAPTTHCYNETRICECVPKYPIPIPEAGDCLDYRKLGQTCLIDIQCQQIEFAVCVGNTQQINGKTITNFHRMNYMQRKGYGGRCQCKNGYKQMAEICYPNTYQPMNCSHTHYCFLKDPKSRCDLIGGQCYCYSKYVFNEDLCRLKTYGDICKIDSECQNWDQNLECCGSQCSCKRGYVLDSLYKRQKDIFDAYNKIVCKLPSEIKKEDPVSLMIALIAICSYLSICSICVIGYILLNKSHKRKIGPIERESKKGLNLSRNMMNLFKRKVSRPPPDVLLPSYEFEKNKSTNNEKTIHNQPFTKGETISPSKIALNY